MGPGPSLFGPNPLAAIVAIEPNTWEQIKVKSMCVRVSVWSKIIPNPRPWMLSKTPSQSQRLRDASAPPTYPPDTHGRKYPIPETPHQIWAQRGAPRPQAIRGRDQLCALRYLLTRKRKPTHTNPKKTIQRMPTCQAWAWVEDQRTRCLLVVVFAIG